MKKEVILILGILLISLAVTSVYAQGQGNDDSNANDGQGNQTQQQDQNQTMAQNKTQEGKTSSFSPWQKRSEDECPEGCSCHGAVVSCKTESGKTMSIEAGRSGNLITITIDKTEVDTELEIETELGEGNQTKLKAKMKNGETKEVKVMGDEAQVRVRERARICEGEGNCTVKLQEINGELMYEFEGNKEGRLFALFKKQMKIQARIDAETGEVSKIKKPWWALLASEL
ncbi:MAG: hypothetical protein ABIH72_00355 [archaeon]